MPNKTTNQTIRTIYAAMKAAAWARAKGELQALVGMVGSCASTDDVGATQHSELAIAIESFINDIESRGLEE